MDFLRCVVQSFWLKIGLGLLFGILLSLDDYFDNAPLELISQSIFLAMFCTFVLWTGSEYIFLKVNQLISWEHSPLKKAIILSLLNLAFVTATLVSVVAVYYTSILHKEVKFEYYYIDLIFGLLITIIVNLIYIGIDFYTFWKKSKYEVELLKTENIKSQLETLKSQINPHFLFNSLNTLISVVDTNPTIAKDYIQNLSKVYRYILQIKDQDLVTLEQELQFTEAYCSLFKIRFEDKISFNIEVDDASLKKYLPSLVLQILIENAIKHNAIGEQNHLKVEIYIELQKLIIRNNMQPKKQTVESEKTGLQNIAERYKLLLNDEIEVIQNAAFFTVKIPLANQITK